MDRELVLVGDRVLIAPEDLEEQTESGLVLPATVKEKQKVHTGRVVKVGPGYLMPNPDFEDEAWKPETEPVKYLPLQAEEGDFAFYIQNEAIELEFEGDRYLIVQHNAIVALVREERPDERDIYEEDLDL